MSGAIINSGGHPKMPQAVMPASLPPSLRPLSPSAAPRTRHSSLLCSHSLPGLYLSIPLWLYLKPSASYTILVTFLFLPPLLSFSFLHQAHLYFMTGRVLQLLASSYIKYLHMHRVRCYFTLHFLRKWRSRSTIQDSRPKIRHDFLDRWHWLTPSY